MCYGCFPLFPPETPLYPPARTVLEYLRTFADRFSLRPHIRCGERVVSVEPASLALSHCKWRVTLSTGETRQFDCVVVANGRYRTPFIPAALIEALRPRLRGGSAIHAAWFRDASPYIGKKVLVVGGGPSGNDIGADCAAVCEHVWWAAASTASMIKPDMLPHNVTLRGRIASLRDENGVLSVTWSDGTEEQLVVDCVILATGYELVYPFFQQDLLVRSSTALDAFPFNGNPNLNELHNTPQAVMPLAKHIFPMSTFPDPTGAFVGLTWKLAPFPVVEAQARVAAKVFERSLARARGEGALGPALDLDEERAALLAWYASRIEDGPVQAERLWHAIPEEGQYAYRRELLRFANGRVEDHEEREMDWFAAAYANKVILRQQWRDLEKHGEAQAWLAGVGHGDRDAAMRSWVALMDRVAERGKATLPTLAAHVTP
ncbi:FAD/NAD(P)-binding domain-containing protein [Auricularia subglabra TFB-10046 SS5]|nr:FAD/NAD(P)-binding domain-containing protein [Auricularia subglabra TFB-10046 SS5]